MLNRFSLALAVACAIAPSIFVSAPSSAQSAVRLELPSQPLDAALRALGNQTKTNILFDPASVKNLAAPAVIAADVEQALTKMLVGSGLTYRFIDARTVTLIPADPTPPTKISHLITDEGVAQPDGGHDKPMRLAQADPSYSAEEQNAPSGNGQTVIELEEIVVTGSHIRGASPSGSNLIVINRQQIDRSGYARIEDVLAALPQNFKGINEESSQIGVSNLNFGAEVQLRGLGPGTTLTLVNGHRQAAGGTVGGFVDISSIPTSAIERIEVLADGASAIYGSDAIGGVVNIILRKDYEGAETRVRLGTAGGDSDETQLAQLLGTKWSSGNALIGYQYYERDPLPASARDYTASNFDLRAFGGSDLRDAFGVWMSNPGTILDPLGVPSYAIPSGQDGSGLTTSDLAPGVNYADRVTNSWILPRQQLHSVFLSGSQRLNDAWELSADGRFSKRDMKVSAAGFQTVVVVPSTNPFYVNPFEAELPDLVQVAYDFTRDLGPLIQEGTTDTYSAMLGATGQLPGDWQLKLSGAYGREENTWRWFNRPSSARINAALNETDPTLALNVFGDGRHTNPATLDALRLSLSEEGVSKTWSGGAIADGPLWHMPGGAARLALGIDYRDERLEATSVLSRYATTSGRHTSAAFAELNLPVVTTANARPGFERLELSLAARHEDYSDFGTTFDPRFGMNWTPFSSLTVRGTWGTSFRAPPFYQGNEALNPPFAFFTPLQDPQSPSGSSTVLLRGGNNPDLKEETATVWTAGLDVRPTSIRGLRFALTYFDIDYRNKIEAASPTDTILVLEDQWPTIVNRNPTQAEIDALCGADCEGITIDAIVDQRLRNLAVVHVKGLDFDLNYSLQSAYGIWGFGVGGTRTLSYDRAVAASAPATDVIDTVGNPLALRMRANLSWSLREWTTGAVLNYAGKYQNPAAATLNTVDPWTTVDLNVGYQFLEDKGWLANTRLALNAVNVFDEPPPFVDQLNGYDGANSSLLGRLVSVQLIKGW